MKIDSAFGDNERKMLKHMYDTCRGDPRDAAGRDRADRPRGERHARLGHPRARHLPDGKGPETSALNAFNQMHEVTNVFVVDGSAFPNASEKNPTLSILALSWRATDYLAEELRAGRL